MSESPKVIHDGQQHPTRGEIHDMHVQQVYAIASEASDHTQYEVDFDILNDVAEEYVRDAVSVAADPKRMLTAFVNNSPNGPQENRWTDDFDFDTTTPRGALLAMAASALKADVMDRVR